MIDLGVLEQLVNAMYALGCDEETPVVYAEVDGLGSLELAEEDPAREPLVVESLESSEAGRRFTDRAGYEWDYFLDRWNFRGHEAPEWVHGNPVACFGPYTEILP